MTELVAALKLSNKFPVKFSGAMRVLHWAMAVILISLLMIGLYMAQIPMERPDKFDFYPWHRAFGVLAFALLIIRLIVRFRSVAPEIPAGIVWYERRSAKLAQIALYTAMILMPVMGYAASSALPEFPGLPPLHTIWFFGAELPLFPFERNYETTKSLIAVHKYVGYAMMAVIAGHAAGAFKHRFFDRPENDVLSKML